MFVVNSSTLTICSTLCALQSADNWQSRYQGNYSLLPTRWRWCGSLGHVSAALICHQCQYVVQYMQPPIIIGMCIFWVCLFVDNIQLIESLFSSHMLLLLLTDIIPNKKYPYHQCAINIAQSARMQIFDSKELPMYTDVSLFREIPKSNALPCHALQLFQNVDCLSLSIKRAWNLKFSSPYLNPYFVCSTRYVWFQINFILIEKHPVRVCV